MHHPNQYALSITTASNYSIKEVTKSFRANGLTKLHFFRDVVFVHLGNDESGGLKGAFIFPYGVIVMWYLSEEEQAQILDIVRPYEDISYENPEKDVIMFRYGKKTEIVDDQLTLASTSLTLKLALSYGLSQSVKLSFFEGIIKKTLEATKKLPEQLSKEGKISLSRREMRKKMGELFLERSFINVHLDVLDTPEYFWDHAELEPVYRQIANHLELTTRLEVMNKRLDIIHDLFEMLGNELNHQHSSQLEWAVILLIVLEVILTFLQGHFYL